MVWKVGQEHAGNFQSLVMIQDPKLKRGSVDTPKLDPVLQVPKILFRLETGSGMTFLPCSSSDSQWLLFISRFQCKNSHDILIYIYSHNSRAEVDVSVPELLGRYCFTGAHFTGRQSFEDSSQVEEKGRQTSSHPLFGDEAE